MIKISAGSQTVSIEQAIVLTRDEVAAILRVLDARPRGWRRAKPR